MNDNSESRKICPSCNNENIPTNQYCRHCGASLENVEPIVIDPNQQSETPEKNKVEIREAQKGKKYSLMCCYLTMIILVVIIIIIILTSTNADPVIASVSIAALGLLFIPAILCGFVYTSFYSKNMSSSKSFSISDQEIKIIVPKKKVELRWSDIRNIEGTDRVLGFLITRYGYRFEFFLRDGSEVEVTIERERHFKKRTIKKIKNLIEQYADRLGVSTFLD